MTVNDNRAERWMLSQVSMVCYQSVSPSLGLLYSMIKLSESLSQRRKKRLSLQYPFNGTKLWQRDCLVLYDGRR